MPERPGLLFYAEQDRAMAGISYKIVGSSMPVSDRFGAHWLLGKWIKEEMEF